MHMTYAHAPHERTSLVTPRWAAEMLVAAVAAWRARPRPRAIEPRPSVAKAATIERPVRVGEGSGQRAVVRGLCGRGTEFESWRRPRTYGRREKGVVHGTPIGESNPAATSSSWWQGPPLGLSQTPL